MTDPRGVDPEAELEPTFSAPGARATPWSEARGRLAAAPTYWFTTVRADGRPHVTTVAGVWVDGAMYVNTGETEQKARNLETNPMCALTTGSNEMDGLDVVLEAEAVPEADVARLQAVAEAYVAKYGDLFPFTVRDGAMHLEDLPGVVRVYRLKVSKAFGFRKGAEFSQTRWRF